MDIHAPVSGLDDPAVPKHFDATVTLSVSCPTGERERSMRQRVSGFTWHEAQQKLAERPWDELLADGEELIEVTIEMLSWSGE